MLQLDWRIKETPYLNPNVPDHPARRHAQEGTGRQGDQAHAARLRLGHLPARRRASARSTSGAGRSARARSTATAWTRRCRRRSARASRRKSQRRQARRRVEHVRDHDEGRPPHGRAQRQDGDRERPAARHPGQGPARACSTTAARRTASRTARRAWCSSGTSRSRSYASGGSGGAQPPVRPVQANSVRTELLSARSEGSRPGNESRHLPNVAQYSSPNWRRSSRSSLRVRRSGPQQVDADGHQQHRKRRQADAGADEEAEHRRVDRMPDVGVRPFAHEPMAGKQACLQAPVPPRTRTAWNATQAEPQARGTPASTAASRRARGGRRSGARSRSPGRTPAPGPPGPGERRGRGGRPVPIRAAAARPSRCPARATPAGTGPSGIVGSSATAT